MLFWLNQVKVGFHRDSQACRKMKITKTINKTATRPQLPQLWLLGRHFRYHSKAAAKPSPTMTRILCVAEKPSISKAVAGHLSGGQYQTVSALPLSEVILVSSPGDGMPY